MKQIFKITLVDCSLNNSFGSCCKSFGSWWHSFDCDCSKLDKNVYGLSTITRKIFKWKSLFSTVVYWYIMLVWCFQLLIQYLFFKPNFIVNWDLKRESVFHARSHTSCVIHCQMQSSACRFNTLANQVFTN